MTTPSDSTGGSGVIPTGTEPDEDPETVTTETGGDELTDETGEVLEFS